MRFIKVHEQFVRGENWQVNEEPTLINTQHIVSVYHIDGYKGSKPYAQIEMVGKEETIIVKETLAEIYVSISDNYKGE